jgi:hypothetical protein
VKRCLAGWDLICAAQSRGVGRRLKTFEGFYRNPLTNQALVSKVLAAGQGDFSTCCLWAGDILAESRNTPAHLRYRRWRKAHGEERLLYYAPSHIFEAGERDLFAEVIEMAIEIGWDALVVAVIQLSHDDWIALYARGQPSALIRRLQAFGVRSIGGVATASLAGLAASVAQTEN